MFKQTVVKNCPVTRVSKGVVHIAPEVLAELAGTLEDEKGWEWAVLLHGGWSEDGLVADVTSVSVPQQVRTGGDVDIADKEGSAKQPKDCVGVLHSHHGMGAFFSSTDHTKLNPNYRLSIVISSRLESDESVWLGFDYKAEGRVKLPCGAVGVVGFKIMPLGRLDWPLRFESRVESDEKELGDCAKLHVAVTDGYTQGLQGKCGMTGLENRQVRAVFGTGGHELTKLLPAPRKSEPLNPTGGRSHRGIDRHLVECERRDRDDKQALLYEPVDELELVYDLTKWDCEICWRVDDVRLTDGDFMCRWCERNFYETGARDYSAAAGWKEGSLYD